MNPRAHVIALLLLVATAVSVVSQQGPRFAAALLAILIAHESGHYFAARIHGIPTSPPFFLPMPWVFFGTLGAVILAPPKIARRNALFDFAAAGPLAGLVVAVPMLVYGLLQSPVEAVGPGPFLTEGRSLLYVGIRDAIHGPIPVGHDVFLTPEALAGWAGLLVTMLNLLPVGQLDGGHIGYALLGSRQDVWSRRFIRLLPGVSLAVAAYETAPLFLRRAPWADIGVAAMLGLNWLLWFVILQLLQRAAGDTHPPTDDDVLSPGRRVLGWFTLSLFPLLFMPWFMK